MLRALICLLASVALGASVPAHAQTWDYYFGEWLGNGPSYQPLQTFAHLSVSTSDSRSFDFLLHAYDPSGTGTLETAFGTNAYIGKAAFNSVSGADPVSISNIQTNGAVGVSLGTSDGTVGGITFDFWDGLGGGGTLQSGEWVSWTLGFADVQQPLLGVPAAALLVRGFEADGVTSGWYTPTSPIPEPEALAMMLAGLGLMGFVARRRQRNLAA